LFAKKCALENIIFIGPSWENIQLMGNKHNARMFVDKLNVPTLKAFCGTVNEILSVSEELEYPLLVKSANGGGGKAMQVVYKPAHLKGVLKSVENKSIRYFGDSLLFVEKYIAKTRHIEIQILADKYGNIVHLFDRECSIQRRYQKIIEEAPSPSIDEHIREKLISCALNISHAISYSSAGTIEFLLDENNDFYFLEMNTRLQVEHGITELITGIDIVEQQIKIASGEKLSLIQGDIEIKAFAIEARIYAEDALNNFMPSPGEIVFYREPENNTKLRIDSAISSPTEIYTVFDPLISKVMVSAVSRMAAISLLISSLDSYIIEGITTNIPYVKAILSCSKYNDNIINTNFCKENEGLLRSIYLHQQQGVENFLLAYLLYESIRKNSLKNKILRLFSLRFFVPFIINVKTSRGDFHLEFIDEFNVCINFEKVKITKSFVINNFVNLKTDYGIEKFEVIEINSTKLIVISNLGRLIINR